jgi:hypothetical protein
MPLHAQTKIDLNQGWYCNNIDSVNGTGSEISISSYPLINWLPATVPGTILTTLLDNGLIPDPFYGMNNELITDIYDAGNVYYTYWFVNDFEVPFPVKDEQVLVHFRGINYSCEVFLNGRKVNKTLHKGMFLRQSYNITSLLSKDGKNRVAVIVYPPDSPGNPNGGQGGDGIIGKNVSHQYVAGWDWIQPVRDRNTGIWDRVYIEHTGQVNIENPHIITEVPGIRFPNAPFQESVIIKVSTELNNFGTRDFHGTIKYILGGHSSEMDVLIPANESILVQFPDLSFKNPKIWWPNGYGEQPLYDLSLECYDQDRAISDQELVSIGIRKIDYKWNAFTRSKEMFVNGQKIFVKGGNWIISDAMLRFSEERYDAEIRFHRDMNLNLIRIWGGAITERPEFYAACDKYGLLVWQDFWISGDCNGRWLDPRKKEDQWERRKYPDDHGLFIRSVVDQVKMIRNHPSLAIWCGGNEIGPPEDIVRIMNDTLNSSLDGTRLFIESSTSGELYYNSKGGVGDGPYGIQKLETFWKDRSFPFNPELGSVGTGDYQSLKRFIPDTSMIIPGQYKSKTTGKTGRWSKVEPVWRYHKYIGYGNFIEKYGGADNVNEFANIAQLINYNQYRAMVEGFSSHMWEWYTGFIIWKTQNPWTALRGQMYDWYLDPNAGLYGLQLGSEPLHIMFDPVEEMIMVVNNTFEYQRDLLVIATTYDAEGNAIKIYQEFADIDPVSVKNCQTIGRRLTPQREENGLFLSLQLLKTKSEILSENLYWLPDSTGRYHFIDNMPNASVLAKANNLENGKISIKLSNNPDGPVAFFIRISLVDAHTNERILPVFYSNNYLSIEPGGNKNINLDYPNKQNTDNMNIHLEGWNVESTLIKID